MEVPEVKTTTSKLKTRCELADLCNELGLLNFAVEVGTDQGAFAHSFLSRWKGVRLLCIDPWEPYDEMPYDRIFDMAFAIINLAPFSLTGRIQLLKCAEYAVGILQRNKARLDFCYIDGDHLHADVDIDFWHPLMASGGILAGHDFEPGPYPALVASVLDMCRKHQLELNIIKEPRGNSWYVRIP